MKTVLKVLLISLAVILALKLLPLTLALGMVCAILAAISILAGLGLVSVLLMSAAVLAAALSPLWLPVLLVVGGWALVKRVRTA